MENFVDDFTISIALYEDEEHWFTEVRVDAVLLALNFDLLFGIFTNIGEALGLQVEEYPTV